MIKTMEQHRKDLERLSGLSVMGLLPIDENRPGNPFLNAIIDFEEDVVSPMPEYKYLKSSKEDGSISKVEYMVKYTFLMLRVMRENDIIFSRPSDDIKNSSFFANYSYPKPNEFYCNDASFSGKFIFNNEEYIILFVAEGLSQSTSAYLASHIIERILNDDYFKYSKETDINTCVKNAIGEINKIFLEGFHDFKGLLAKITLLFYKIDSDEIFYFASGNSRLYGLVDKKFQQISQDEIKIHYHDGKPIKYKPTRNAIGFSKRLKIQINSVKIDKYVAFIIANDGMYNTEKFEWIVNKILNKKNMLIALEQHKNLIISQLADDASIALIRFPKKKK